MPIYIPPISRRKFITTTSIASAGMLFGLKGKLFGSENGNVDPDYFILIADTHIDVDPNRENRNGDKMYEINQVTVQRIVDAEGPRPAAVILNGDAANVDGKIGEYENILEILKPLSEADIPVYITFGNHDNRPPFFEIFPDKKDEDSPVSGRHLAILETPNVYLFLLDTLDQVNQTPGILGPEQLEWLDTALDQHDDKPVIIIGHHYPWPNVDRGLMDYDKFYDVILPKRHVKSYIFGHSHRWDLRMQEDLRLINQPANGGNPGSGHPTGIIHFRFYDDRMALETDAYDRSDNWHGQSGTFQYRADEVTSVEEERMHADRIQLHQNYPNPFNPKTTISYELTTTDRVNLTVYDVKGRHIKTLIDEIQNAGRHEVIFNAANLASGTYIYKMVSGERTLTKSMTLMK